MPGWEEASEILKSQLLTMGMKTVAQRWSWVSPQRVQPQMVETSVDR